MTQPTIGELTDALFRVREKKREVNKKLESITATQMRIEGMLMEALDNQQTRKGEGSMASVSISTTLEPTVKDWDAAKRWILRHKELELFQHRLSPVHYRNLLEEYPKGIPGVEPFEKRKINLRKLSS